MSEDYRLFRRIAGFIEQAGRDPEPLKQISISVLMDWCSAATNLEYAKNAKIPLCENCDLSDFDSRETFPENVGECRLYPPRAKVDQFPRVLKDEWCGQHRWKYTRRANDKPSGDEQNPPNNQDGSDSAAVGSQTPGAR